MTAVETAPQALIQGSFAIFGTPDGGLLLVWKKKGTTEDRYMPIPAFMINMAAGTSGMTPDDIIAKITTGDLS